MLAAVRLSHTSTHAYRVNEPPNTIKQILQDPDQSYSVRFRYTLCPYSRPTEPPESPSQALSRPKPAFMKSHVKPGPSKSTPLAPHSVPLLERHPREPFTTPELLPTRLLYASVKTELQHGRFQQVLLHFRPWSADCRGAEELPIFWSHVPSHMPRAICLKAILVVMYVCIYINIHLSLSHKTTRYDFRPLPRSGGF